MRAPMRSDRYVILFALLAGACGKEIGDPCIVSSDCSQTGDRLCLNSEKEGYCTIMGCDYNTCPSESECVRFFAGSFEKKQCDPRAEDQPCGSGDPNCVSASDHMPCQAGDVACVASDDCSLDELCPLAGHCVPRSSEVRYCMLKCGGSGD